MSDMTRAVLFVNGEVKDFSRVRSILHPTDVLIAVDGGVNIPQALGLIPHWLIGDLDSISEQAIQELRNANVQIRRYPTEKNETDLELAVLHAMELGHTSVLLVGILGGRTDHALANLFLLEDPRFRNLELWADDGEVQIHLVVDTLTLHGSPGDLVSLIPLSDQAETVTTYLLKYPLLAETLVRWRTRGISNEMLNDTAIIKVGSGSLLCIHTRNNKEKE